MESGGITAGGGTSSTTISKDSMSIGSNSEGNSGGINKQQKRNMSSKKVFFWNRYCVMMNFE
jgi:hypothetical protein